MEELIFNKDYLDVVKAKMVQFKKGIMSETDFWKFLISHKAKILQSILKKLPSVLVLNSDYQGFEPNNQTNQDNLRLQKELKERNDLLVLVSKRINNLCNQDF